MTDTEVIQLAIEALKLESLMRKYGDGREEHQAKCSEAIKALQTLRYKLDTL